MGSSSFFLICILHSVVALGCGVMMIFYTKEIAEIGHGTVIAKKLRGSTPYDQLLIETSNSFSGLLLFAIGFLLLMVAIVKDREFQSLFAKGCVLLHITMSVWRVFFERKLEESGPGRSLETLLWPFHGFSCLFTHGGRSMIKDLIRVWRLNPRLLFIA